MTAPLISIVVGVYNGAATLEHLIDSVAAQTLAAKELVIFDGGSTDGTVEILRRRSADIAHWTSEPDQGLYDAWNKALDQTRGRYIGFLGADDALADPSVLERLADHAAAADPPDLIASLNVMVNEAGQMVKVTGRPWSWGGMRRACVLAHPGLLHRRDLFDRIGRFDPAYRIGGDYEWLLRLGPTARTEFVPQITALLGDAGMSHTRWRRSLEEIWRLQALHLGTAKATRNLVGNVVRLGYRKLRGRR